MATIVHFNTQLILFIEFILVSNTSKSYIGLITNSFFKFLSKWLLNYLYDLLLLFAQGTCIQRLDFSLLGSRYLQVD